MEIVYTLSDIEAAAAACGKLLGHSSIFAFHGQMGSGKTTFIAAMCRQLQVQEVTGSPTYAIIHEYSSSLGTVYHMDLYRLANEAEAIAAGVEDCLYSGNICLVEWPEKAASLFPEATVHLELEVINETTRRIRIRD